MGFLWFLSFPTVLMRFIGTTVQNDVVYLAIRNHSRISKHTEIPDEAPEAIVRVQDAETLQKAGSFVWKRERRGLYRYFDIAWQSCTTCEMTG
jgi:hypothetical protein